MHVSPDTGSDIEAAMRFYPWEILGEPNGTGAREPISRALYATEVQRHCKPTGQVYADGAPVVPVYVAADARMAVMLVQRLCSSANVVVPSAAYGATRTHTEVRSYTPGYDRAAAQASSVLDFVMLSYARDVYRIGAQHSSFASSAATAGCGVRLGRAPQHWRFKSAASWLLAKVEYALNSPKRRGAQTSWQAGGAKELYCASSIAAWINTTPCGSPCLVTCRDAIRRAYS